MIAKTERARRQARELAAAEYSKPAYAGHFTIGAAQARSAELAELVSKYQGKVKRIPCTGQMPRFSKHFCDPRTRNELVPCVPVRAVSQLVGIRQNTSRLIKAK
jgi:hypothetical protein